MEEFKYIGSVSTNEDVRKRINDRFHNLFQCNEDGKQVPFVCSFCDEILFCEKDVNYLALKELKKQRHVISWNNVMKESERIKTLENEFQLQDKAKAKYGDVTWLRGLALSPRGCFGRKKEDNRSPWGISSCSSCKTSILKGETPLFAIANQNHVGHAPPCLEELTAVELSLISPVKNYGYCFSYIGGANLNLKGTMTFMRVEESSIARGAAQLLAMGLQNTMVVILSGKMTTEQKKMASRSIRVDKVVTAVEWLCKNNKDWKDVSIDEFKNELEGCVPCVVDRSKTVESENTNVETKEMFSCYFPEEGMDDQKGVFENNESFKVYVEEMQKKIMV